MHKPSGLLLVLVLVTSCALPPKQPIVNAKGPRVPLPFETGVRLLTNQLLRQVENEQERKPQQSQTEQTSTIAIHPLVAAKDSGTILTRVSAGRGQAAAKPTGLSFGDILRRELKEKRACGKEHCRGTMCEANEVIRFPARACPGATQRFPQFVVTDLSAANRNTADYILYGVVDLKKLYLPGLAKESYYRLHAAVLETRSGQNKVVAKASVLVAEELFLQGVARAQFQGLYLGFRDSGLDYLLQDPAKQNAAMTPINLGELAQSVLAEADAAYEAGRYDEAWKSYRDFTALPEGRTLHAYSQLYSIAMLQNKPDVAAEYLPKLAALEIEESGFFKLPNVFLFEVGAVRLATRDDSSDYTPWLQQIGAAFQDGPFCLHITGHGSRSGSDHDSRCCRLCRHVVFSRDGCW